jgi:GTP cyclohydrolase I
MEGRGPSPVEAVAAAGGAAPSRPGNDVQAAADGRGVAVDWVGVRGLRLPATVVVGRRRHSAVARCGAYVGLPPERRGAHMSRLVEALHRWDREVTAAGLGRLLRSVVESHGAARARIEIATACFRTKRAPVTGVAGLVDYDLEVAGEAVDGRARWTSRIVIPVTSLCPCSKEVSAYGAHSQRSHVTVRAACPPGAPLERIIAAVEEQASCGVFSLLKRPDEKHVTERAYDNPRFAEDMVRDVALRLRRGRGLGSFRIEVENFESIHNHSAYAMTEWPAPPGA